MEKDLISFKKQRNYVTGLIKKAKKLFFSNIDISPNEKDFWKACKPYLVSKSVFSNERLSLLEGGELKYDECEVATIFNSYFGNILSTLNISLWNKTLSVPNNNDLLYPEYGNHPSIIKTRLCEQRNYM